MNKRAIFFIRHFNDLDQFTPVIHRLVAESGIGATLCFFTPYYYSNDYRVKYLRSLPGVMIMDLRTCLDESVPSAMGRIGAAEATAIFDECLTGVDRAFVAMDWVMSTSGEVCETYGILLEEARRRGLASVSLPHGDSPQSNRLIFNNQYRYEDTDIYGPGAMFDYVVTPNELCARRYRPHLPESRIRVLGSPRYNGQWMELHDTLLPAGDELPQRQALNVAIFLAHPEIPTFWEEVGNTLRLLAGMPGVHVLVAGHSRKVTFLDDFFGALQKDESLASRFTFQTNDTPSSKVIEWADLILDMGTSICFEAVCKGKSLLAMEYLHGAQTTIATYMPETGAFCRDHLLDGVTACMGGNPVFPTVGNRERFLREVVDCGADDVLAGYRDFLHGLLHIPDVSGVERACPDNACAIRDANYAAVCFPNEFYKASFPGFIRLARMAERSGCRDILELGAGTTTLLWAEHGQRTGARVTSIDRDFSSLYSYLPLPRQRACVEGHVTMIVGNTVSAESIRNYYEQPREAIGGIPVADILPYLEGLRRGGPRPFLASALRRAAGGDIWRMRDLLVRDGRIHFDPILLEAYGEGGYARMLQELAAVEAPGIVETLGNVEQYDLIFFDSGELASLVEWELLKPRIRRGCLVAFHDIFFPKSFKNFMVCASLLADKEWTVRMFEEETPQGLMVFERTGRE